MFLDKETLLKIWVNLGLNVTIFLTTGLHCTTMPYTAVYHLKQLIFFRANILGKLYFAPSFNRCDRTFASDSDS